MLLKAITLDTAMTASEVLARLARHGFWVDPMRAESREWIEQFAQRVDLSFEEAERRLARDGWNVGLALRRQYHANVLWYAQPLDRVLHECHAADPAAPLLDVLDLHEHDGQPPIALPPDGSTPGNEGVVFLGETPVAISMMLAMAAPPSDAVAPGSIAARDWRAAAADSRPRGAVRGNGGVPPGAPPVPALQVVRAWPRIDAPEYMPAREPFTVAVGLAELQQPGVAGGQIQITAPAGATTVEVSVELLSEGLDAPEGWTRTLSIEIAHPTKSTVRFVLVGRDPAGNEPYRLTTLEIRYVLEGTVCGTASRALVIGRPGVTAKPTAGGFGTPWLAQAPTASPVVLQEEGAAGRSDDRDRQTERQPGNGQFQCRLYSPHPLTASTGPFPIDLGQDAKTFAEVDRAADPRLSRQSARRQSAALAVGNSSAIICPPRPSLHCARLRRSSPRERPRYCSCRPIPMCPGSSRASSRRSIRPDRLFSVRRWRWAAGFAMRARRCARGDRQRRGSTPAGAAAGDDPRHAHGGDGGHVSGDVGRATTTRSRSRGDHAGASPTMRSRSRRHRRT